MKKISIIKPIATCFGIGYLPMPGTMASLAGLGLYLILTKIPSINDHYNPDTFHLVYSIIILLMVCLGIVVCGSAQTQLGTKDDRRIVLDEVIGILVSFWGMYLSGVCTFKIFLLFRLFDIWKPFPLKSLEKLPGSFGIIADDIAAGIYANISGRIILTFMSNLMK